MKKSDKLGDIRTLRWFSTIAVVFIMTSALIIRNMIEYSCIVKTLSGSFNLSTELISINRWSMGFYFLLSVFVSLCLQCIMYLKKRAYGVYAAASIPALYTTGVLLYLYYDGWM